MMRMVTCITTHYDRVEDRIYFPVALRDHEPVRLWLTQRLASPLLKHLLHVLNRECGFKYPGSVVQSFEQQVARSHKAKGAAIDWAPGDENWLVETVQVSSRPGRVRLIFRAKECQHIILLLTATELRQWLDTVYRAWVTGNWPRTEWPEWMHESRDNQTAVTLRH